MNVFIIKIILEIEIVYSSDCLDIYSTVKKFSKYSRDLLILTFLPGMNNEQTEKIEVTKSHDTPKVHSKR